MITLTQAIKSNRLREFVDQETKRGIGPADSAELETAIKTLATQPQSEDRTSRSTSDDGSSGT